MKSLWLLLLVGWVAPLLAETPFTRGNPSFDRLEAYLFPPAGVGKSGVRTDGFVVWHDGQVRFERYGVGYTAHTPHLTWSVTKSFVNAMVGIAVREKRMAVTDSLCRYFPKLKGDACKITVEHLLRHESGLKWDETYEEGASPTDSSVLSMLYGEGHKDMAAFTVNHPVEHAPGEWWEYTSGGTNVLMAIVKKAMGPAYDRMPWRELFDPLGMKNVTWERDGAGVYVGSSYLYATPLDQVQFGRLFLEDGVWEGKRLLPEGWVKYSTAPAPSLANAQQPAALKVSCGALWWLNTPVLGGGVTAPWPEAPADTFAANGHWGQFIVVVPSKRLVVVRTGDDRDGTFDGRRFLALLTEVIP